MAILTFHKTGREERAIKGGRGYEGRDLWASLAIACLESDPSSYGTGWLAGLSAFKSKLKRR